MIWVSLTGCRFFPHQQITSGKLLYECHFPSFLQLSSGLHPQFSLVIWVFVPLGARDPPVRRRHTEWRFFLGLGGSGPPRGQGPPQGPPGTPQGPPREPQGPQGPLGSKKLLGAAPPGSVWCWSVFWCSVWCWPFFLGALRCQAPKHVPLVKLVSVSFGCGNGGGEEGGEGGRGRCITVPGVKKYSVGQFGVGLLFFGAWRCPASKNVSLVKLVSVTCLVRIAAPSKHQQICFFVLMYALD